MKKTRIELDRKSKNSSKTSLITVVFFLVIGIVAGYFIGKYTLSENCIPQEDLDFFMAKANQASEDYEKCVADAWNLQLSCKMQVDAWKKAANSCNATAMIP